MLRKWEWISSKLEELDAPPELIAKAKGFDEFINENYRMKYPPEWKGDYEKLNDSWDVYKDELGCVQSRINLIEAISGDMTYCSACIFNRKLKDEGKIGSECEGCKVKEKFGECFHPTSALAIWIEFFMDWKREVWENGDGKVDIDGEVVDED